MSIVDWFTSGWGVAYVVLTAAGLIGACELQKRLYKEDDNGED